MIRLRIYSVAASICICGLLVLLTWKYFFDGFVLKQLPLASTSETFKWWSEKVPLYTHVYLFNWTNAEAILEKPTVDEVGPYTYRMETYRQDFTWHENDTLTYTTGQNFFFEPELSKGDPQTDIVFIPNLVLLSIKSRLESEDLTIPWSRLYVKKTVSELLFEGYSDQILEYIYNAKTGVNKVKNFTDKIQENVVVTTLQEVNEAVRNRVSKVMDNWGLKEVFQPVSNASENVRETWNAWTDQGNQRIADLQKVPDRFPGLIPVNGTRQNFINIHTGKSDMRKFGLIHACHYQREIPVGTGSCGRITYGSSMGDFWPVNVTVGENAFVFVPDLCSSVRLNNLGKHLVHDMDGIRFEGSKTSFGVPYSGVRNLSSCVNAPMFVSFPHFHAADPIHLEAVNGLRPDKHRHAFYLTLHKDYGVSLDGAIRLQINALLDSVLLPVLWFETKVELPATVVDKLHFLLTIVPSVIKTIGWSLILVGVLILAATACKAHSSKVYTVSGVVELAKPKNTTETIE